MIRKVLHFFIKYFTVIFLFAVLLKTISFYTDYCATVYNIFFIPTLITIILINVVILYLIDYRKGSFKITNRTLLILLSLTGLTLAANTIHSRKEIKYHLSVKPNYNVGVKGFEIKLYEDQTYEISGYWQHGSCHYFGNYELENDTLKIFNRNVSEKTQNQMTTHYQFNRHQQLFEPIEEGYPVMSLGE